MMLRTSVGLTGTLLALACGAADGQPTGKVDDGSGGSQGDPIEVPGSGGAASGGAGSSDAGSSDAGSGGSTTGGSSADGTGGSDDSETIECDPIPEACPELRHEGDLDFNDPQESEQWRGLTHLDGDLDFGSGYDGDFSEFECLEHVTGTLEIWTGAGQVIGSFPRLVEADRIHLYTGKEVTCALSALTTVDYIKASLGAAGELDLSGLTSSATIIAERTHLTRIFLPERMPSQLAIYNNSVLEEVTGLGDINPTENDAANWGTLAAKLIIEDNPALSHCWAEQIAQPFLDVGYDSEVITVQNNGPCE